MKIVATAWLPAVDRPNARTPTAGTPHARANILQTINTMGIMCKHSGFIIHKREIIILLFLSLLASGLRILPFLYFTIIKVFIV